MMRKLEDYVRRHRGQVKHHEPKPGGGEPAGEP